MKKGFLLVCSLFIIHQLKAQSVYIPQGGCGIKYEYDAVGNRISRYKYCWPAYSPQRPAGGVEQVIVSDKIQLEVFPNPSSATFVARLNKIVDHGKIEIQDVTGNVLQSKPITDVSVNFDIEALASGIYFVVLTSSSSDKKLTKQLIKN
jgi:hypothetical protein